MNRTLTALAVGMSLAAVLYAPGASAATGTPAPHSRLQTVGGSASSSRRARPTAVSAAGSTTSPH
ncbi:hypothetical protein [Kitasatospora sp. NPDC017646]|uniref:hypothetical protein n=1 Tax=Kitasatospora sp. NPDC017646 TaxID=3364024 RepID=UPI00378AF049